ncbi:MAG: hypothetical protein ACOYEG_12135 [Petrimonas sp.]|jgi:hypothetical protein
MKATESTTIETPEVDYSTINEAFEAGKKIGFIEGYLKVTGILIKNIQNMQKLIIDKTKGGTK